MEHKRTYSEQEMHCALSILDWFFTLTHEVDWDEFGGFQQLRHDIIQYLAPQIEAARVKAYERLLTPAQEAGFPICFDLSVIPEVLEEVVLPTTSIRSFPQEYWDQLVFKVIWMNLEGFKAQNERNTELSRDQLEEMFSEAFKNE